MKFKQMPSADMEKHVPKKIGILMWFKSSFMVDRFDLKYIIKDIETTKLAKEILWKCPSQHIT